MNSNHESCIGCSFLLHEFWFFWIGYVMIVGYDRVHEENLQLMILESTMVTWLIAKIQNATFRIWFYCLEINLRFLAVQDFTQVIFIGNGTKLFFSKSHQDRLEIVYVWEDLIWDDKIVSLRDCTNLFDISFVFSVLVLLHSMAMILSKSPPSLLSARPLNNRVICRFFVKTTLHS